MKRSLLITTLLALGGCAASYTEPSLPADHPASPAAAEAPPPARSATLDVAAADPVGPAPAEPAVDYSGHGEGEHKDEGERP